MSQLPLFQPPSWTVADITRYLRQVIETDELLQDVWVIGEVSNCSRPSSGHLYFTLKDSSASLKVVMWRSTVVRQVFIPRDGDAVEVHGSLGVYEAGGSYQLYADTLRPTGEGLLYQEFLRLKARLEAEGLFDPERKRPIPRWPRQIGIVTSPTGAALRDMLTALRRRYPLARVIISPAPVQGDDAPPRIVEAIRLLNRQVQPDVILLARGGGSIEDLWAFNDERVARAISASRAPVICGIGHETDFTIADFAADLRAPTPTAAAELAVPDRLELAEALDEIVSRMQQAVRTCLATPRWELREVQSRLALHSPESIVRSGQQRLDELIHRLETSAAHTLQVCTLHLHAAEQRLNALNPSSVLNRGYAIVQRKDGSIVTKTRQVSAGDRISVRVSDGAFGAQVSKDKEEDHAG